MARQPCGFADREPRRHCGSGSRSPEWLGVALRLIMFVLAMVLVVAATSVYVFRRGARLLGLGPRARFALAGALALAPVLMVLSRVLAGAGHVGPAYVFGVIGATVVLGVMISTVLLWAVDLPFGLWAWIARFRQAKKAASGPSDVPSADAASSTPRLGEIATADPRPDELAAAEGSVEPAATEAHVEHETVGALAGPRTIGRRELIRNTATGAALSVGFGSALYGAVFGRRDYQVVEVPVPIPGLSPRLDGYRIAQLSDIHFGLYIGEPELESAVELVRSARPDMVVLTGDLVDHDPAYAPWLGRLVRRLEQLKLRDGVIVVPGNHDYYAGIDAVLGAAHEGGGRILRNSGRVIGDAGGAFALLGVDDVWAERAGYGVRPDLDRALAMVPNDIPRVLLCHNPEFFPKARGKVALQLSGHTHGGQVNLGLRPAEFVLPYVEGLYQESGSHLYVNRGFGTAGPPARVGAPPECTLVVLTAA